MKSDLDIIIDFLQKEVDDLKEQLDTYIYEKDFLNAHIYQNSFRHSVSKLNILKSLKDPLFPKKSQLRHTINNLRTDKIKRINKIDHLSKRNRHHLEDYYNRIVEEKIQMLTEELDTLEKIVPSPSVDDDRIREVIENLLNYKVSKAVFELKDLMLFLELSLVHNAFQISITASSEYSVKDLFNTNVKNQLKKLGFDLETYVYSLPLANNELEDRIMEFLSKLFFEALKIFGKKEIKVQLFD